MHGELALLYAEDLGYYARPRGQGFREKKYREIDAISINDCDSWFSVTPFQLRQLFIYWRVPTSFTTPNCNTFTGEECFLIF